MVLFECFSSQVFVARNFLVMQSTLTAFVVGVGAQRCARPEEPCTDGTSFAPQGHVSGHVVLGGLPDAATGESVSVSSSTPWTAVSKSWGQIHQRGGNT